jgi:hypothetical protein
MTAIHHAEPHAVSCPAIPSEEHVASRARQVARGIALGSSATERPRPTSPKRSPAPPCAAPTAALIGALAALPGGGPDRPQDPHGIFQAAAAGPLAPRTLAASSFNCIIEGG